MNPPKVKKWRDVRKVFREYGIETREGASPGHRRPPHPLLVSPDGQKYPIPARGQNDDVSRHYIDGARRKFGLTPENGISDEEFWGKF